MTRPSPAKLAIVVVVVALVGYVAFVVTRHVAGGGAGQAGRAPAAGRPPASSPVPHRTAPPRPFPPSAHVFLGLQTNQGGYDFAPVDAFSTATGYRPSVLQFTQGWATPGFDRRGFDRVAARGMLPVMSWEPWNYQESGPANSHGDQPTYRLANITAGRFDDYIRTYAQGIKGLDYPVAIRFAHEMNGFWYPWCEQSNGNRPGDYVKAWRHVHDIFTQAGATNVIWIWSPNVTYAGAAPLSELYPGDAYLDWIGLSGYYGTAGMKNYRSFDSIFNLTLTELGTFTHKPIVVTETGATDSAGRKAAWIQQMFQELPHHSEIIGVIWFEAVKELDWRVVSDPAAAAAYRQGAADPRYQVTWSPNTVPLTQLASGGG
jgi:mannan endo-1,4-beta-mannosidase